MIEILETHMMRGIVVGVGASAFPYQIHITYRYLQLLTPTLVLIHSGKSELITVC